VLRDGCTVITGRDRFNADPELGEIENVSLSDEESSEENIFEAHATADFVKVQEFGKYHIQHDVRRVRC